MVRRRPHASCMRCTGKQSTWACLPHSTRRRSHTATRAPGLASASLPRLPMHPHRLSRQYHVLLGRQTTAQPPAPPGVILQGALRSCAAMAVACCPDADGCWSAIGRLAARGVRKHRNKYMARAWNPVRRRTVYCGTFATEEEAVAAVARYSAGSPPPTPPSPMSTASASSRPSPDPNDGVSVAWLVSPDGPVAAFCDCLARKAPVPCRAGCGLAWGLVYHAPERRSGRATPPTPHASNVLSGAGRARTRVRVRGSHYRRKVAKRKDQETGVFVPVAVSEPGLAGSRCPQPTPTANRHAWH